MKKYTYVLTKQQQKNVFISSYYHRPILWFQRMFLGPFLMILGMPMIFFGKEFTALAILYLVIGLFYIIRPFILQSRIKFTGTNTTIEISENDINITDENGNLKIRKENIKALKVKGDLIFIQIQINYKIWLVYNKKYLLNDCKEFIKDILSLINTKQLTIDR